MLPATAPVTATHCRRTRPARPRPGPIRTSCRRAATTPAGCRLSWATAVPGLLATTSTCRSGTTWAARRTGNRWVTIDVDTVVITLRVMVHHHAERDDYGIRGPQALRLASPT